MTPPEDKEQGQVPSKEPKPQRHLYELCPVCGGTGIISESHPIIDTATRCSHCKKLNVIETGLTVGQAAHMAKMEELRMTHGISAAMLRDGRAGAFRDLLAACKLLINAGCAGESPYWEKLWNSAVEQGVAAIDKAEKGGQ